MKELQIYRRRYIPDECILLKDDELIEVTDERIITRWKTLHPKTELDHGSSCYFLKSGVKVSKFYNHSGELMCWYCDIVQYDFSEDGTVLTVTDLLADVVVYPSGRIRVILPLESDSTCSGGPPVAPERLAGLKTFDWAFTSKR
ncbi:MAG: DUF402 domain-containing protein, partial [Lachnospiraceae bacterium]|nr:DUF402 domain-containing protein [Lachnospiraceae bacterium]